MSDFEFDDSLEDMIGGPQKVIKAPVAYKPAVERSFSEPCPACNGTGRWGTYGPGRPCFKCKSTGKLTFKTAPDMRAKSKAYAATRKANNLQDNIATFSADHPTIWAWMERSINFPFAVSLKQGVEKWGGLTEKQLAAAYNCVAKYEAAIARNQARKNNAPEIKMDALTAAFDKAASRGLKTPGLRLDTFAFKRFGTEVAVWDNRVYVGKIIAGKLQARNNVTDEQVTRMQTVASDPAAAAIAFGRRTGNCSCCGKELTVKESVDRGIGPICYAKYF